MHAQAAACMGMKQGACTRCRMHAEGEREGTNLQRGAQAARAQLGLRGQRLLEHGLEGGRARVGLVLQEAEVRVQLVHAVLDRRPAQAPAPARLRSAQRVMPVQRRILVGCPMLGL